MNNKCIRNTLLNNLFISPAPKYQEKLFQQYYFKMFPCKDKFEMFLNSSSEESRINIAKQIIERLNYNSNLSIPNVFFLNLLDMETTDLSVLDGHFAAQDHFVHIVNLYLTGIYLFFNHSTFHNHLYAFFQLKRPDDTGYESQQSIKNFITSWKYFCLVHDLGYIFEAIVKNTGSLKEPKYDNVFRDFSKLDEYVSYILILKFLSKITFFYFVLSSSSLEFGRIIENIRRKNSGTYDYVSSELIDKFEKWNSFVKLEKIYGYESLKFVKPAVDISNLLIVLKNENDEISLISYEEKGKRKCVYNESNPDFSKYFIENILRVGCDELPASDYKCEYYYKFDKKTWVEVIEKLELQSYKDELHSIVSKFYDDDNYLFEFSTINNYIDIDNFVFKIYTQLLGVYPLWTNKNSVLLEWSKNWGDKLIKERKVNLIVDDYSSEIYNLIQGYSNNNIDEMLKPELYCKTFADSLSEYIKTMLSDDFIDNILKKVDSKIDADSNYEASCIITAENLTRELCGVIRSAFGPQESLYKNKKVNYCYKNEYSKGYTTERFFVDYLPDELQKIGAIKSGTKNNFSDYVPSYAKYDHGLVSANIMLTLYEKYNYLASKLKEEERFKNISFLLFSWGCDNSEISTAIINKYQKIIFDIVYSIFIHNIYPSTYESIYGRTFKHKLQDNSFAYFSMFCDSIQVWDRPLSANQSKRFLNNARYYGDLFDIYIEDEKVIKITYKSHELKTSIDKLKMSLDEFLLGASSFINLSLDEMK